MLGVGMYDNHYSWSLVWYWTFVQFMALNTADKHNQDVGLIIAIHTFCLPYRSLETLDS